MLHRMPLIMLVVLSLCIFGVQAQQLKETVHKPEPYKRIDNPGREEVSGIIASRQQPGVFWVHGDSGTDPRIYAINREGDMFAGKEYEGAEIADFKNTDWEDITLSGTKIILADIGNNCTCRENLAFILFEEPLYSTGVVNNGIRVKVKYPGERRMWGLLDSESFDAEGVFAWNEHIYVITKEENQAAQLFTLKDYSTEEVNVFEKLGTFDFGDEVTAADMIEGDSGPMLAVLTYSRIWLFSSFNSADDFFSGEIRTYAYRGAGQTEALTFENSQTLIMTNENGDLFEINVADFTLKD